MYNPNAAKLHQAVINSDGVFKGFVKGETLQEREKKARVLRLKLCGTVF